MSDAAVGAADETGRTVRGRVLGPSPSPREAWSASEPALEAADDGPNRDADPGRGRGVKPAHRLLSVWRWRVALDVVALNIAMVTTAEQADAAPVLHVVATLAVLGALGGYRRRIRLSVLEDVPLLVRAVAGALLAVAVLGLVADVSSDILRQAVVAVPALIVGRVVSYAIVTQVRRRGRLSSPTVVLGAGAVGQQLCSLLGEHTEYGLRPLGVVDDVVGAGDCTVLGPTSELEPILRATGATRLIVAFSPVGEQDLVAALRAAAHLPVEVYVVPRFFELGMASAGADVDEVFGVPLYPVRRAALQRDAWIVKRVIDVVVAGTALLVLSPLLAALALAVRLSSRGPILFRQQRVGQGGRLIEVLKFRSMHVNLDSDSQWSVVDDPRMTPLGRLLRSSNLDELPQLWNVVKGDMSLVGPRPERPVFVDRYSDEVRGYADRHRLPAGLTGLAQVHGLRGDTSIQERARFDNAYIEHWGPWLDIKVLLRTGWTTVRDTVATVFGGAPSR